MRGTPGESVQVLTIRLEDEYKLFETKTQKTEDIAWWLEKFALVWAAMTRLGYACLQASVYVGLTTQADPVSVDQYLMSREARAGITFHIGRLLQLGGPAQVPLCLEHIPVACEESWYSDYCPHQGLGTLDWKED